MKMTIFNEVEAYPTDPIFGLQEAFKKDANPRKVDLTLGVYRGEDLKTVILPSVKEAEHLLNCKEEGKVYLPIGGDESYIRATKALVFGKELCEEYGGNLLGVQSVGGTGALFLGGKFLYREIGKKIYLPSPTWPNHSAIFAACGMELASYPYYNGENGTFAFDKMVETLSKVERGSIVLLHGCCHNPTGCDPTKEQWRKLSALFHARGLIAFFDFAYQGFGCGIEEDAFAIRHFAEKKHEMFVAASYSKTFALYGERIGTLFITSQKKGISQSIASVVQRCARTCYSNPPRHGAGIIKTILESHHLKKMWEAELDEMRVRLSKIRCAFVDTLNQSIGEGRFDFLRKGKGLFAMLGLSQEEVKGLMDRYAIYVAPGGRINLSGLNLSCPPSENFSYVIDAIVSVLE